MKQTGNTRATATPQWFGPKQRRLFGWVHRPAGELARAVVVVCPSMGQEAVFSHHPLRVLADELAAEGCVVVRFDYDGTGDSQGGAQDPDRVESWLTSIEHAVALGRKHSDAPVILLGFRLGGLLAAEAAARRASIVANGLVLWDAPRSGKQFLRELVVRQNVSVGWADSGTGGSFTALGVNLTPEASAELSQVNLRRHRTLPAHVVLSVDRAGVNGVSADARTLSGEPINHLTADDQDDLLSRHAVPVDTMDKLVAWCARTYPAQHRLLERRPAPTASVTCDGVREYVTSVGPNGLFGIVTEPADPSASTSSTAVVFVPDSITPHGGLSRIWTEQARQWAAAGVRSLRFDLSGCADSAPREGIPGNTIGQLPHVFDAMDAVRHASPDDPTDTILVGLCSGAYLSTEAALALAPRGLALVNPVLSFITHEPVADPRRRAIMLTRRTLGRLVGRPLGWLATRLARTNQTPAFTNDPNFAWNRAFEACFWQVYLHTVLPRIPDRVWRLLNKSLISRGLDGIVETARAAGTETVIIAGEPDFDRATLGSLRRLRAIERQGGLTLVHHPELDHAMMRPGAKDDVARSLTEFVLDRVARRENVLDLMTGDATSATFWTAS